MSTISNQGHRRFLYTHTFTLSTWFPIFSAPVGQNVDFAGVFCPAFLNFSFSWIQNFLDWSLPGFTFSWMNFHWRKFESRKKEEQKKNMLSRLGLALAKAKLWTKAICVVGQLQQSNVCQGCLLAFANNYK